MVAGITTLRFASGNRKERPAAADYRRGPCVESPRGASEVAKRQARLAQVTNDICVSPFGRCAT